MYEIKLKEVSGARVVTFEDIDKAHERVEGTSKNAFSRNRSRFIEGKDYYKISRKEFNDRFGTKSVLKGNPNLPTIMITESGYFMISKTFNDDLAWAVHRSLVENYFGSKNNVIVQHQPVDNVPSIMEIMNKQTAMIEADLKRNEEFRQAILDGFSILSQLIINHVQNSVSVVEPVPVPVAKTEIKIKAEESFSEWREKVFSKLPKNKNKRNEVLCDLYKKMNNVYGVCWDQQKRDFKNEIGRSPVSTLEVAHWLDCKKEWKGIFHRMLHEVTKPKLEVPFPVTDVNQITPVVQYIAQATGNKSKNGCSIFRGFMLQEKSGTNWNELAEQYVSTHNYRFGKDAKSVRKMDIAREYKEVGEAIVKEFNAFVMEKYGELIC